jgi:hypothetical protein
MQEKSTGAHRQKPLRVQLRELKTRSESQNPGFALKQKKFVSSRSGRTELRQQSVGFGTTLLHSSPFAPSQRHESFSVQCSSRSALTFQRHGCCRLIDKEASMKF